MWTPAQFAISDIDECASDVDNCDTNANCINIPGSFTCACNLGYSGDGLNCVGKSRYCPSPFSIWPPSEEKKI